MLANMAAIMEIKGEVVFKSIAFSRAGRIVKDLAIDVKAALDDGSLARTPGIGQHTLRVIDQYARTGRSADYDELAGSLPAGLLELLEIPGLGPKTISLFWKERNIAGMGDLIKALDSGYLDGLKGIGPKKLDGIRAGIAFRQRSAGRILIGEAQPIARSLVERLRRVAGVEEAQIAGSLRRCRETIGDVDLLCSASHLSDGPAVAAAFVKFPEVQRIQGQGQTKASILTTDDLQVDLRIVPADSFGAALLYFTGSKEHNVKLRGLASARHCTLNEWGLYKAAEYDALRKKAGEAPTLRSVAGRSEAEVYAALGLDFIEPELREDRGEVEAAGRGELPRLVGRSDIRGDLHTHTIASDGVATIEEMARTAVAMGYEYLAITDHSKGQTLANGLNEERLLRHVKEIRQVGRRLSGIKLLAGCEVDILADGTLDFEDAILAELDMVIASPHAALKQDALKATDRLLRAIDNRYVNIIGHPTGRMINSREGLPLDMAKIFKLAAANGTALEINASYQRLDLNEISARAAVQAGVKLAVNTDSHSTGGLQGMEFGLGVARRGWVRPQNVINCMGIARLEEFIAAKRRL